MGEAKRRGTFEERLAKAVARNQALEGKIADKPDLVKFKHRYGMQRMATRLIMSGLLTPPPIP
jgi:hypothetical protein